MAKLTHEDILAYLEEATILELNDLVSAIEEKFGVTAAAPVAAAPVAEAAEAAQNHRLEFDWWEHFRRKDTSRSSFLLLLSSTLAVVPPFFWVHWHYNRHL